MLLSQAQSACYNEPVNEEMIVEARDTTLLGKPAKQRRWQTNNLSQQLVGVWISKTLSHV